ncbi:hypothetical protein [Paenibacillus sp. 1P07SE]|uniref:hypothetical protein n=1 Tax=Paenibacillus sp. 1P07SE TaxID=3132209 RepID=UPI0039A49CFC
MVWYPDAKPERRKTLAGRSQKSYKSKKRAVTVPAVTDDPAADQTPASPIIAPSAASEKAVQNGISSEDIVLWAAVVTVIGDSLALLALLKARQEGTDS